MYFSNYMTWKDFRHYFTVFIQFCIQQLYINVHFSSYSKSKIKTKKTALFLPSRQMAFLSYCSDHILQYNAKQQGMRVNIMSCYWSWGKKIYSFTMTVWCQQQFCRHPWSCQRSFLAFWLNWEFSSGMDVWFVKCLFYTYLDEVFFLFF